ncbi:hypothetical protein PAMA_015181 [Pampus argenteus]
MFLWRSRAMDLVRLVCLATSIGAWFVSAERHSVYWNSSNPNFLWNEYTVEVRINDYLDIICPHYTHGEVPSHTAERYVLYMVEREDYEVCKPHSFDQLRWECSRPFALHAPEKFSEKFQRFTPFTLGKEFRLGESYYYICKYLIPIFIVVYHLITLLRSFFVLKFPSSDSSSQANTSPWPGLSEAESGCCWE